MLQAETWQQIALVLKAEKMGIAVSDQEVRDEIMRRMATSPLAYNDAMYQRWVQNVFREGPRAFEEKIRDLIRIRKLLDSFPTLEKKREFIIQVIHEARIRSYLEEEKG